jgi:hypothetical protein
MRLCVAFCVRLFGAVGLDGACSVVDTWLAMTRHIGVGTRHFHMRRKMRTLLGLHGKFCGNSIGRAHQLTELSSTARISHDFFNRELEQAP